MPNQKKAFTLIELLVVIAIIGLLATFSVIALDNARAKARDAKRVADIKQVQTALELFFNDKGRYPTYDEFNSGSVYSTSTNSTTTYMQIIPAAANPPDGSCTAAQNQFGYSATPDGTSYTIDYCIGGRVSQLSAGPKCATPGGILNRACFVCGDNLKYGEEFYPTVQIGTQCWFAKNLDIGTMVTSSASEPNCHDVNPGNNEWSCQINPNAVEKYCYDNDPANCAVYGGLYEWAEAMNLPYECNNHAETAPCVVASVHQGICPDGWHVPSHYEGDTLAQYVETYPAAPSTCTLGSGNCSSAGGKLKEIGLSHWDAPNSGATNAFNFTALGGGYRNYVDGLFGQQKTIFYFWFSRSGSRMGMMFSYDPVFNANGGPKVYGFSVRCLKN